MLRRHVYANRFFFSVQSFRHRVCAPATFIFVILFCFNHCTKVAAPSLCTSFFHFGDFFFNCCTKVAAPCLRTRYIYFIVQKHLLHQGCGTMSVHQLLVFLWFILVYFFNYCTKSKVAAPCLRNSYWKPGKTYYFNLIFIVQRLRHHVWSPATFIFWFIFWKYFFVPRLRHHLHAPAIGSLGRSACWHRQRQHHRAVDPGTRLGSVS